MNATNKANTGYKPFINDYNIKDTYDEREYNETVHINLEI